MGKLFWDDQSPFRAQEEANLAARALLNGEVSEPLSPEIVLCAPLIASACRTRFHAFHAPSQGYRQFAIVCRSFVLYAKACLRVCEAKNRTLGVQRRSLRQGTAPVVRQVASCRENSSHRMLVTPQRRRQKAFYGAEIMFVLQAL